MFALAAVSLAAASSVGYTSTTADIDFLVKQKKVFELLMYVDKHVFTDAEFFEVGHHYDIPSHIDYYTNKVKYHFLLKLNYIIYLLKLNCH